MSELNAALDFLSDNIKFKETIIEETEKKNINADETENFKPFDINLFIDELASVSFKRNEEKISRTRQNITGYDIAHNCIQQVLFKLRNTPLPNYSDPWLPIFMRTQIGNAVHEFIQSNSKQFTETELNLKVPSIGFYGKVDYMCGPNILGEIKTCTYSDYLQVIKKQQPRTKDYLQAMCYQYILENYIDEIQSDEVKIFHKMGLKPKHDKYDIQQLQFVYIAHDMMSADVESYTETVNAVKQAKKVLGSKQNPFFFITTVTIDLDEESKNHCNTWIKNKIDDIHQYMLSNTNPKADARFLTKDCFFCPYKEICDFSQK